MATLAESNKRLEEEKSLLIEEKSKLELQVSEQREQIKRLERELSSVKADTDEIEKLKKKCVELTQEKADLQVKFNEEISSIQKENFEKMLEIIKAVK